MRIAYKPELLKLDYDKIGKIKLIGACSKCVVVVTEENKIFMKNAYIKHISENDKTGVREADPTLF